MSIYHERHIILRSPKEPTLERELAGQVPMSQIQRVMAELGIEAIPVHSPQAKALQDPNSAWVPLPTKLNYYFAVASISQA